MLEKEGNGLAIPHEQGTPENKGYHLFHGLFLLALPQAVGKDYAALTSDCSKARDTNYLSLLP